MKTCIVIPAYNEEKTIGTVLRKLKDNNYKDIIVVDDGSKDNTVKLAKEAGVQIIPDKTNFRKTYKCKIYTIISSFRTVTIFPGNLRVAGCFYNSGVTF